MRKWTTETMNASWSGPLNGPVCDTHGKQLHALNTMMPLVYPPATTTTNALSTSWMTLNSAAGNMRGILQKSGTSYPVLVSARKVEVLQVSLQGPNELQSMITMFYFFVYSSRKNIDVCIDGLYRIPPAIALMGHCVKLPQQLLHLPQSRHRNHRQLPPPSEFCVSYC